MNETHYLEKARRTPAVMGRFPRHNDCHQLEHHAGLVWADWLEVRRLAPPSYRFSVWIPA